MHHQYTCDYAVKIIIVFNWESVDPYKCRYIISKYGKDRYITQLSNIIHHLCYRINDAKYLKDIADAGKMSSRESDHKQRCSIFFVIAREIICCSDFVQLLTQSCFFFSVFPCFVNAISAIGCPDHSHSLYSQQLYIRKVCINQLRKMIKKLKLV